MRKILTMLMLAASPALGQGLSLPPEIDETGRVIFLGTITLTINAMLRASELAGVPGPFCLGRTVTQADVWNAASREIAGYRQPVEIVISAVRQLSAQYPCR